jgi:MFS family permease
MKENNYKWIALSCTSFGALFSVLSGSTLMIALPVIMKDLNTDMNVVTWTIMGYMLAMTILVPSIGRIADMVGRKKLYVSGFAIFTFASFLCVISQTGMQLLIYRIVQSVGGSLMVANSTAIVADAFSKKQLGKALGINSMIISIA